VDVATPIPGIVWIRFITASRGDAIRINVIVPRSWRSLVVTSLGFATAGAPIQSMTASGSGPARVED